MRGAEVIAKSPPLIHRLLDPILNGRPALAVPLTLANSYGYGICLSRFMTSPGAWFSEQAYLPART